VPRPCIRTDGVDAFFATHHGHYLAYGWPPGPHLLAELMGREGAYAWAVGAPKTFATSGSSPPASRAAAHPSRLGTLWP